MKEIGPAYGQALQARLPDLVAQLEAVHSTRDGGRAAEPELPGARSDGVLADLGPMTYVD
jgi:hypothetical protein